MSADLPANVLAYIDQHAADMRDQVPDGRLVLTSSQLAKCVGDTLEQLAQGVEEAAPQCIGVVMTLPEVAQFIRNNSRAYLALAAQLPGGAS